MAKVLVNFQDEFLQEIDKVAEQEHRTRSSLIREAVRRYLSQCAGNEISPVKESFNNSHHELVSNQA